MAHVNTVLGPIHPEEIGITAMHEHLMWGFPGWEYDSRFWFNIHVTFEDCYKQMMDFKLRGGGTYVDCSGIGMGRDLDFAIKLSGSTGINIVASTGFGSDWGITPHFRMKETEYFEELFVRELTLGMGHTLVKAGVIRVGKGRERFTKLEENQYRAAARAARRTGAAVIAHGAHSALEQLQILSKEKLDPSRIVISHLDRKDCLDFERDKQIARAGAYVAYDHVGLEEWSQLPFCMPDERRVDLVMAMVKANLQDRLLLATNSKCRVLGCGESSLHNTTHMLRYFVPKLKEAGVKEETLQQILVKNPKHVLPIQ
jgi:phosphotriesterase-related protein